MSTLAIRLLGPPRVERDGGVVSFDTRKAIALLAYLAARRGPVRRETLALLLWPDYPPARALANLRRTLWSINAALGPGRVTATPAEVALAPSADLWVDLDHFHRLLDACRAHAHGADDICTDCITWLSEAAELVRGPFLEGFGLSDSPEFDDWQVLQAASARQSYADALRRLAQGHVAQGDLSRALEAAERLAALEPLHEPDQRRLMLLLAWVGRYAEALHHYHALERHLARELGASPESETIALRDAIKTRREPAPPHRLPPRAPESAQQPSVPAAPGAHGNAGAQGSASPAPAPGTAPALVAREHELARLEAQLRAALGGETQVVFIVGEAGSGKTALLEGFVQEARRTHPDVVTALGSVNAYLGVGDPYLPFRQILEQLADGGESHEERGALQGERQRELLPTLARALIAVGPDLLGVMLPATTLLRRAAAVADPSAPWLQQLRRVASAGEHPADLTVQQRSLFEQYARVLRAVSQERPLLLALDDLQWADLGSINLLIHLGMHGEGCRLLIVGAYRAAEVALGRQGERHPLEPVVHELQRRSGVPAIDLNTVAGRPFIDALLDQQPNRLDDGFRATLYRHTGGHALFTVELIRGMQERGDLSYDDAGRLVAGPTLDWERLPARVDAVIAERVGRLAAAERELLWAASAEGEEFSAEVVAQILGRDEGEVLRQLSRHLARAHDLVRFAGVRLVGGRRLSRYRFGHFLIQRYLYQSLDPAERAYWHDRLATTLEALYGERSEAAVELAHHAREAGRIELAIRCLRRAGDYALRLSANDEAAEHYRLGLTLLEQLPETPERKLQELELQAALSKPLQLTLGYSAREVGHTFERAIQLGRELGNPPAFLALLGRYVHFLSTRGEHRRAGQVAEALHDLAMQADDELLLLDALTARGIASFYRGEHAAAAGWLDQALGRYDRERHRELTYAYGIEHSVHLWVYAMLTRWLLGEPEAARELQALLLAEARASKHPHTLAFALAFLAVLESVRRDVPATLAVTAEAITLCEAHHFGLMLGLAQLVRGWALSAAGSCAEGLALYRYAEPAAAQMQVQVLMPYLGSLLADILWRCGRADEAQATIDGALALAGQTGEAAFLRPMRQIAATIRTAP